MRSKPCSWERVVSALALARKNLLSVLERVRDRPMASALIDELKTLATEVERSKIEDAVGAKEDPKDKDENPCGRGRRAMKAGYSEGGKVRQRGRLMNNGNRRRIQRIAQPKRSRSRTNRIARGECWRLHPGTNQALARVLHAYNGNNRREYL